ncbi:MAG TPA: hypothetical protein VNW71_06405 [Thermoanaerobaculia bacterium]|nr:hypothetical protein [Thermoanaerobaculia bacterium]
MSPAARRVFWLRLAIALAAIANLLALAVLVRGTPLIVTVYMFLGPPLFLLGFVVLVGAILADLRAKELL